jgi:CHASE3 domain sensor protein
MSAPGARFRSGPRRTLFRVTVVTIIALFLVFAISATLLRTAIVQQVTAQERVRNADAQRFAILNLQLDEETSLRGYDLTLSPSFLGPLHEGLGKVPAAMNAFAVSLSAVDPQARPLLGEERRLNAQWLKEIAEPVLASRRSETTASLLRGKSLIDRFRTADLRIADSLAAAATRIDANSRVLVARIVDWTVALLVLLVAALVYYAWAQARLLAAYETRTREYERERNVSETLQRVFLFEPLPDIPRLKFDAAYQPAEEHARVGGDWYGATRLQDGRIFFTVGDVAGHGLQASVTMARARQTILVSAIYEADPAVALLRANDVLRLRGEQLVTAICGFIDSQVHSITYSNAGHAPPLLIPPHGQAAFMESRGLPIGVLADPMCSTLTREIEPGSTLVF